MHIFKCNSLVNSSAPLISIPNVSVPTDDPSGAPSTALTCSYVSVPSSKTSSVKRLYCAPSIAFKGNSRYPFKSNITSTIKCNFQCNIRSIIICINLRICAFAPLYVHHYFAHICTLKIASTSATTYATQVQPYLQPHMHPFVHLYGVCQAHLWMHNCTMNASFSSHFCAVLSALSSGILGAFSSAK